MMIGRLKKKPEKELLLEKLEKRYSQSPHPFFKLLYWRKKFSWWLIVGGTCLLKRLLDITVSAIMLIILSPLLLLTALLIKLFDRGPVFYVTTRVGLWGKEFQFPKFRTMIVNADCKLEQLKTQSDFPDSITFKMKHDPRITPIGKFLRKFSLDELPQLWCVLKGEMSLVGPRPPLPKEVELYTLKQRGRLDIKPGLTCFWQINGRSEIPFERQVGMDKEYIESQSFWLDLKLLIKTIPAIFFGRGAY